MSRFQPQALSLLRIVAAYLFLAHGLQKSVGLFGGLPPQLPSHILLMLKAAGWLETIGGVLLLLGLFTSPVAFLLSGEMAAAYFIGHVFQNGLMFLPMRNGGEPAVLYCFVYLYLATSGGGSWSLDHAFRREKPAPSDEPAADAA